VTFIDGSVLVLALSAECVAELRRVIHQVQLSFSSATVDSPRSSVASARSSAGSSFSSTSSRRSTSSLLLSILSPLLSNASAAQFSLPPAPPQTPARIHRRQARSLLVDTYRKHVLPSLRDVLPSAYLAWAIDSETAKHMEEFERLRSEITALLSRAGIDVAMCTPMKRGRSSSSCSSTSDSTDSNSDFASPLTPATSIFSPSSCSTPVRRRSAPSPYSFLSSIPATQVMPSSLRNAYANHVSRLSSLVSRLSSITKLQGRYEREEGKRRWLDSLEMGRQGDKSLRRAFSNGQIAARVNVNAEPIKRSGLWRSWSAVDQARAERSTFEYIHPAMMSPVREVSYISDVESEDGKSVEAYSPSPSPPLVRPSLKVQLNLPELSLDDNVRTPIKVFRPTLTHRDAYDETEVRQAPNLVPSLSDDSLPEMNDWDMDASPPLDDFSAGPRWEQEVARMVPSLAKPAKALLNWETRDDYSDPCVRVEMFDGVQVVYSQ